MNIRNLNQRSLLNNIVLFSGSTTIAQIIMMIYVIFLARILGPEQLGIFSSAYSLAGLSAIFLNLGMDTWLLRKSGIFSDIQLLSGKVLEIKAVVGILWSITLVLLFPVVRPDLYNVTMMIIVSIDIWSDVCFNTQIQALNVQKRMKTITGLLLLSRGGRLVGLVLLFFIGADTAVVFALARATATFIGFLAATRLHRPKFNTHGVMTSREVITESLPFGASDFLALIYTNADVTILALIAGATAVGYYSPASGIIHALFVIPNAIFNVIVPQMTNLWARDINRFRKVLPVLFGSFIVIGAGLWAIVSFSAKWLIPLLLGEDYIYTGEILKILSPILFFKFISFACAAVLVVVGWQQRRLIYQLTAAIVNIIANVLVIPSYGIIGVAWVYVFSEFLLVLGYIWVTLEWIRKKGFKPHIDCQ